MSVNIAIIPARGGSKRLPGKNARPFCGRPIIVWTIEAARQSGLFERIVVSTDDGEIARHSAEAGAEVHPRPAALGADNVRVVEVLKAVLDWASPPGRPFDYLCCLYPTAPLRTAEDLRASYERLVARQADYCCAVADYEVSPFFAFDLAEDGQVRRRWPELANLPHGEKPKVVFDNGSTYWVKAEVFRRVGEVVGENMVGYRMPRERSVDIDTEVDFRWAEFLAQAGKNGKRP